MQLITTNALQKPVGYISVSNLQWSILLCCNFCVVIHVGYYQCFAKNHYGMAMSQISPVQLGVLGSFPTRQVPQQRQVNHGDELVVSMQSNSIMCVKTLFAVRLFPQILLRVYPQMSFILKTKKFLFF